MGLIDWQEHFALGIPAVDQEHRELIELINELHEHIRKRRDSDRVTDFLGEIYARISAHFALEEREMRYSRYDQFEAHKSDHERLLDEIRDIMDDYDDGAVYSDDALSERLSAWFTLHFKTHDARLHALLEKKRT